MEPKQKEYILLFSFGNYLKADGGTDKLIAEHIAMFSRKNYSTVQVGPVQDRFSIVVDGCFWKLLSKRALFCWLAELSEKGFRINTVFIHHFLKYQMEFFEQIADATSANIVIYLHDYYTVCDQYNLLKNGEYFCGSSCPSDEKCSGCAYRGKADTRREKLTALVEQNRERIRFIAPSESTRQIWSQTYSQFSSLCHVVLHQKRIGKVEDTCDAVLPLKIAFIGRLVKAKGADVWARLVAKVREEKLPYELYYFGFSENPYENVQSVSVRVDGKHPDAMVKALKNNGIDIVLLWSTCPETYSYAYFEALEANSLIFTGTDSGNIAYMTEKDGSGFVYQTEEALLEAIGNSDLLLKNIADLRQNRNIPEKMVPNEDAVLALLCDSKAEFHAESYAGEEPYIQKMISFIKTQGYLWKNRKVFSPKDKSGN